MSVIAVIPARGGSKRIPRKNVKPFRGKPMIAWAIETAIKSHCFDFVIVSTDDDEIKEVATQYGALVPFRRAPELSDDNTGTFRVVQDAVQRFEAGSEMRAGRVCKILPTSPLLGVTQLQEGGRRVDDPDTAFVFSIARSPVQIFRTFELKSDGRIKMFWPENHPKRSQDLQQAYYDAGKFYWGTRDSFMRNTPVLLDAQSRGLEIPWWMATDIDDDDDWSRAEWLASTFNQEAG